MVSKDGVSGDETRVEVVKQWSISKNVHDVQSFHGLVSLYRCFIPNFNTMKAEKFEWTVLATQTSHQTKQKLTTTPVLVIPNFAQPFELHYDASKFGIRAILS